ncbi:uncharacterized protein LOC110019638 isoform X2 [Phalaenopsis equestris]|uniref:uncharacterized protein LOC110019638 isoform X2 n=1 Tax=Phalaenopsis equestris TaxID=78828 RepID=UPI0009E55BDD|nr:uncharacterized protein LOC110019638 isoform X2 [Phalaenopsis equestris]
MDPNPSSDQAVVTIDVHSTKTLLNSGHRYLDVRTAEEFENGHLEKSLNVPYMFLTPQGRVKNQKFLEEVIRLCNRDDFIVVGCQSGVRSLKAAEDLLVALGSRRISVARGRNDNPRQRDAATGDNEREEERVSVSRKGGEETGGIGTKEKMNLKVRDGFFRSIASALSSTLHRIFLMLLSKVFCFDLLDANTTQKTPQHHC